MTRIQDQDIFAPNMISRHYDSGVGKRLQGNVVQRDTSPRRSDQTTPKEESIVAYEEPSRPPEVTQVVEPILRKVHAGEVSRLLALPRELRDLIYRHVFRSPVPVSLRLIEYDGGMPFLFGGEQVISSKPMHTALLLVNRQLHAEAAAVPYSENTFRFYDTSEIGDYINWERGQDSGRRHPRDKDIKEELALKLFSRCIQFRNDKSKFIRSIQIVSICDDWCVCQPLRLVGGRWGLVPVLKLVRTLFENLRIIELRVEFPRYRLPKKQAGLAWSGCPFIAGV
ncbi:hypothetical protein PG984_011488 [Apiospora sp. TS-2023a]